MVGHATRIVRPSNGIVLIPTLGASSPADTIPAP